MRIVAGQWGGRRLNPLSGRGVRPTQDRVREAVFSILQMDVPDAVVLDLFSGCGSIGIEALSRGAEWCVFVERDRGTRRVLEENLAQTRLAEFCDVIEGDVFGCLGRIKRIDRRFRLIFADPPYPMWRDPDGRGRVVGFLDTLVGEDLVPEDARFVVHHDPKDSAPQTTGHLELTDQRKYGRSAISMYAVTATPGSAESSRT